MHFNMNSLQQMKLNLVMLFLRNMNKLEITIINPKH